MLGKQDRLKHLDKFGRRFSSNKPKDVKKLMAVSCKKGVVENFSDISSSQDSPQPTSRRLIAREGMALSGNGGISPSNENDSTLSPSEPKEPLTLIHLVDRDTTRSELGGSIKPPNIYSAFEGSKGAKRIDMSGLNPAYTSVNVWKHGTPKLNEMSTPSLLGNGTIQSPMNSNLNTQREGGNLPNSSPYMRSPSNKGAGTLGTLAELSKESQANSGSIHRLSVSSKSPRNRSLNALMRNSWRVLEDQEELQKVVPCRVSFPKGSGSAFGSPTRTGKISQAGGSATANMMVASSPRNKDNMGAVPAVAVITAPKMYDKAPISLDVSLRDDEEKLYPEADLATKQPKSPRREGDKLRSSLILKPQKPANKPAPKISTGGGVSSALKLIQNQYRHKTHTATRFPHQKTLSGTETEPSQGGPIQTDSKPLTSSPDKKSMIEETRSKLTASKLLTGKPQDSQKGTQQKNPSSSPGKKKPNHTPKRPFFTKKHANTSPESEPPKESAARPSEVKPQTPAKPTTPQAPPAAMRHSTATKPTKPATNTPMTAMALINAASHPSTSNNHHEGRIAELQKSSSVKNMCESRDGADTASVGGASGAGSVHGLHRTGGVRSFVGLKTAAMFLPQQGIAAMAAAKTGEGRLTKEIGMMSAGGRRESSKDSGDSRFAQQFASRSLAKVAKTTTIGLPAKKLPSTAKSRQSPLLFGNTLSSTPGTTSREVVTLSSRADKQSLLASERAHLEFEKKKHSYLHRLGVVTGNTTAEPNNGDKDRVLSETRSSVRDKIRAFLSEPGHISEHQKRISDCYYFSGVFADYLRQSESEDDCTPSAGTFTSLDHLSSNITGYFAVTRMEKLQSSKKQRASWSNLIISTPKKLSSGQKDRSKQFSQSKLVLSTAPKSQHKITVIFDMDETLMHCPLERDASGTVDKINASELSKANFVIRPGALEGLQLLKKDFSLGLFTSSDQFYADSALKRLNLDVFDFKLYRQHCKEISKGLYVKDLKAAKSFCDSERCFLVDNNMYCYSPQLHRGVPILPFYGSQTDVEFPKLVGYLQSTLLADDPFKFNADYFGYDIFGVGGEAAAARLVPLLLERVLQYLQSGALDSAGSA